VSLVVIACTPDGGGGNNVITTDRLYVVDFTCSYIANDGTQSWTFEHEGTYSVRAKKSPTFTREDCPGYEDSVVTGVYKVIK
jgi:hypothetical protein